MRHAPNLGRRGSRRGDQQVQGDVGADVEWILKAGGVVSRGTPNFFAQNERNARSADR